MTEIKINQPKVSVLIPVFNREQYIAECIQSALNQIFKDFEIVVVDNASDDGTWEICKQFAALDQRVRILRNETNIGPVRNWLRCAQEAKGPLSKILFSDDTLEPNCLSEMVPKLSDNNVGLVYCAALIGKSRNESIIVYSNGDSSISSSKKFIKSVVLGEAPVSPGAALMRTADLLKNLHINFPTSTPRRFAENGAGPDVMLMLLTSCKYKYIAYLKEPLVFFRAHKNSFSIANINHDIDYGYRSIFAYFLKKDRRYFLWLYYLAELWVRNSFSDPRRILSEYEGSGSFFQVLGLLVAMPIVLVRMIKKLVQKLMRKFLNMADSSTKRD